MSHDHYKKSVKHLDMIDVYRVVELFDVPAGPIDHAVKKLLCAGGRGHKDLDRDIQDAIDSLERWKEMRREDGKTSNKHRKENEAKHLDCATSKAPEPTPKGRMDGAAIETAIFPEDMHFSSGSSLNQLMTFMEVCRLLRKSRSGLHKLMAKDPSFPKPMRDGNTRQARTYFSAVEIAVWQRSGVNKASAGQ